MLKFSNDFMLDAVTPDNPRNIHRLLFGPVISVSVTLNKLDQPYLSIVSSINFLELSRMDRCISRTAMQRAPFPIAITIIKQN